MGWLDGIGGERTPETQSEGSSSSSPGNSGNSGSSPDNYSESSANIDAAKLHEVTSQMAERELRLREEVSTKDAMLRQCENRVDAVERRIRERDAQVTSLKEERAAGARQIENLKNQLYQLVSVRKKRASACAASVRCNFKGSGREEGEGDIECSRSFQFSFSFINMKIQKMFVVILL